jgi:hypothetical protein
MRPNLAGTRWEVLEATAQFPEVQAVISDGISRGTIRVIPAAGGGIRIISPTGHRAPEALEPFPPADRSSIRLSTMRRATASGGLYDDPK